MYYLRIEGVELVGSSPEILVRCEDGLVSVRPIAGTRRRGETMDEDAELERRLLADAKERAEHIMLVDLGRNDVGRVAERGSVHVESLMNVERYSHVMHMVSNVTGKLGPNKTVYDVLKACFPAGTVSGAPKSERWKSSKNLSRPGGALCRCRRLCQFFGEYGHVHQYPYGRRVAPPRLHPGRRGHRCRLES